MPKPTSFRLPAGILERLTDHAALEGLSVTALVASLLDEGLKCRRFPGIVFRDGPAGRRAALVHGLDVWQVIHALQQTPGKGEAKMRGLLKTTGMEASQADLALDFYSAFPEEVDARIADNERAGDRVRREIERRERLMTA